MNLPTFTVLMFTGWIVPAPATQPPGHAMPSSRYPSRFPAFAIISIFRHSRRPSAFSIWTCRSGARRPMTSATAAATPPVTAKPRPKPVPSSSLASGSSSSLAKSMPLASKMPCISSKVSTKSTSERIVRRLASAFLAAQGPMKTTFASG